MAYGSIKVIPASSHAEISLSGVGGGTQYPSIKILNPNDGVVYVSRNRDCMGVSYGDWDWKIPSQSYGALPGPFQSVGAFYLDQSGAGHQGEITVYASQQEIADPLFVAIGRALQAQATSLDINEGALPTNPGAGILRLWADGTDLLHLLNGAGADRSVIDTLRALGGVLTGTLPNPGLAANSVTATQLADGSVQRFAQLADTVVIASKLADLNVTTAKIADLNVTTAKIATNAVSQRWFLQFNPVTSTTSTTPVAMTGSGLTLTGYRGGDLLVTGVMQLFNSSTTGIWTIALGVNSAIYLNMLQSPAVINTVLSQAFCASIPAGAFLAGNLLVNIFWNTTSGTLNCTNQLYSFLDVVELNK